MVEQIEQTDCLNGQIESNFKRMKRSGQNNQGQMFNYAPYTATQPQTFIQRQRDKLT